MGRIRVGTRCNSDSTRPTHTTHCKLNSAQLAYVLTLTPSTARPARALLLASFVRLSGLKTTHLAQCTIFISFPKFSTLKLFLTLLKAFEVSKTPVYSIINNLRSNIESNHCIWLLVCLRNVIWVVIGEVKNGRTISKQL